VVVEVMEVALVEMVVQVVVELVLVLQGKLAEQLHQDKEIMAAILKLQHIMDLEEVVVQEQ
jgi:hypothetical protein